MTDERAVSVTVGYVLNVAVATLVLGALLIAVSGHVTDREESVLRTELTVVGERLVANLLAADRLAAAATGPGSPTVVVQVPLPERVAGHTYRIRVVDPGSQPYVELRVSDPSMTVRVPVRSGVDLRNATVSGGDLRIAYDAAADVLEVHDDG